MMKRLRVTGSTVEEIDLTAEEEAQVVAEQEEHAMATAEKSAKAAAEAATRLAVKSDTFVQTFIAMTPAGVAAYVTAATDGLPPDAAKLLRRLALIVRVLAKRELGD